MVEIKKGIKMNRYQIAVDEEPDINPETKLKTIRRDIYCMDMYGRKIYEEDKVYYQTRRVTSGGSQHGQFTTLNDGYYRIPGIVRFSDGKFIFDFLMESL